VKNPLIRWFTGYYAVDLSEAENSDAASYESFNAFFTRRLKPNSRPIAGDEQTVISPVDGYLTQFGSVCEGMLIQAKGMDYQMNELLGEPQGEAASLMMGSYATLYLAPNHYHRVHLPLTGTLNRTRYIPGKRFSVNQCTVSTVPQLFCRNERVVCWFDTTVGILAMVLVGALNVSSISTKWLGEITSGKPKVWYGSAPQSRYERGEEIGQFNLGSTVILILPPKRLIWRGKLRPEQRINMGEALGEVSLETGTQT
jgi:phosphatidylserine decarboxylase